MPVGSEISVVGLVGGDDERGGCWYIVKTVEGKLVFARPWELERVSCPAERPCSSGGGPAQRDEAPPESSSDTNKTTSSSTPLNVLVNGDDDVVALARPLCRGDFIGEQQFLAGENTGGQVAVVRSRTAVVLSISRTTLVNIAGDCLAAAFLRRSSDFMKFHFLPPHGRTSSLDPMLEAGVRFANPKASATDVRASLAAGVSLSGGFTTTFSGLSPKKNHQEGNCVYPFLGGRPKKLLFVVENGRSELLIRKKSRRSGLQIPKSSCELLAADTPDSFFGGNGEIPSAARSSQERPRTISLKRYGESFLWSTSVDDTNLGSSSTCSEKDHDEDPEDGPTTTSVEVYGRGRLWCLPIGDDVVAIRALQTERVRAIGAFFERTVPGLSSTERRALAEGWFPCSFLNTQKPIWKNSGERRRGSPDFCYLLAARMMDTSIAVTLSLTLPASRGGKSSADKRRVRRYEFRSPSSAGGQQERCSSSTFDFLPFCSAKAKEREFCSSTSCGTLTWIRRALCDPFLALTEEILPVLPDAWKADVFSSLARPDVEVSADRASSSVADRVRELVRIDWELDGGADSSNFVFLRRPAEEIYDLLGRDRLLIHDVFAVLEQRGLSAGWVEQQSTTSSSRGGRGPISRGGLLSSVPTPARVRKDSSRSRAVVGGPLRPGIHAARKGNNQTPAADLLVSEDSDATSEHSLTEDSGADINAASCTNGDSEAGGQRGESPFVHDAASFLQKYLPEIGVSGSGGFGYVTLNVNRLEKPSNQHTKDDQGGVVGIVALKAINKRFVLENELEETLKRERDCWREISSSVPSGASSSGSSFAATPLCEKGRTMGVLELGRLRNYILALRSQELFYCSTGKKNSSPAKLLATSLEEYVFSRSTKSLTSSVAQRTTTLSPDLFDRDRLAVFCSSTSGASPLNSSHRSSCLPGDVNKSRFLVQLLATFKSADKFFFLIEPCPGGELHYVYHKLAWHGSRAKAKFYSAQVLLALEFLHVRGFLYRDLKPENVLVAGNGYCKLTDFGLAKKMVRRTTTS